MATFRDNSAIIPEQASVDNTRHSLMLVCFGSENEKNEACLPYFFTSMQRFSTDFSGHSSRQPLLRINAREMSSTVNNILPDDLQRIVFS